MIKENSTEVPQQEAASTGLSRPDTTEDALTKKSGPRLGIGMPVYNAQEFVSKALDCLLAQSFTDFEIVINDNGSDDRTQAICEHYAKNDARIKYCREETNQGAAYNFTRVFHLSRGEFFKWAAADDLCHPDFLLRCIQVLDEMPEVVCSHSYTRKIDSQGRIVASLSDPTEGGLTKSQLAAGARRPDANSPNAARRFLDVLFSSGWGARSFGVIRRAALAKTTLIKPHYGWEKVAMAELALQGQFFDIPEYLFFQRVHAAASSNLTSTTDLEQFYAPQQKNMQWSNRFRLLQGYHRPIWRLPLSWSDRLGCLLGLGAYLCQFRKWPRTVSSMCSGKGIGDAGKELEAAMAMQQGNDSNTTALSSFNHNDTTNTT